MQVSKLLHKILKFINYANVCKFIQNQWRMATSLSFLGRFWFCLFYLIGLGAGFKTSTQNFEINLLCKFMQIYSKSMKNATSVISWPILILFVLSDRAWCGLQNFYTEFWNSFIMQIYANLFKINEKCYFSVISWPILILFVLSDRAWCGLQNFYTEFWNSLIMQIYANSKSMKNATSPLFRNYNRSALPAGTYITHRVIYYPLVCHSEAQHKNVCFPGAIGSSFNSQMEVLSHVIQFAED